MLGVAATAWWDVVWVDVLGAAATAWWDVVWVDVLALSWVSATPVVEWVLE